MNMQVGTECDFSDSGQYFLSIGSENAGNFDEEVITLQNYLLIKKSLPHDS